MILGNFCITFENLWKCLGDPGNFCIIFAYILHNFESVRVIFGNFCINLSFGDLV